MTSFRSVHDSDLVIEGPEVVKVADSQKAERAKVQDAGDPLAHVHPMNPEKAQEGQQYPGDGIVDLACPEPEISLTVHRRDQEKVYQPPDAEQTQGEEPDCSSQRLSV